MKYTDEQKEVNLSKGFSATVDYEDYEYINQWPWYAFKNRNCWYAIRREYLKGCTHRKYKTKTLLMHRTILARYGDISNKQVDHINRNGLDNRKCNLRLIDGGENQMNMKANKKGTSKYKGVSWNKNANKWHSQIMFEGKQYHIGYYNREIEAAEAYDSKAVDYFGYYARLNNPQKPHNGG